MHKHKKNVVELSNYNFLVTGGAGFIGSNLVEYLLKNGCGKVRILDNFSTGYEENIKDFFNYPSFELFEGDIRDMENCKKAVENIDFISHHAALGSVQRSVKNPLQTNDVNVKGFLNMLYAAKESKSVKRFVYASSSSVYGNNEDVEKIESRIGAPLSPYAASKLINEFYAKLFSDLYGICTIGLRYFNVFGPKQRANGLYSAVVPLFIAAAIKNKPAIIYGDGEQVRDFTFVENVVQANLNAFFVERDDALNQIYNIACGEKTSIIKLLDNINQIMNNKTKAIFLENRIGDITNSLASISKAETLLNYKPSVKINEGLRLTINSYDIK